MIRVDRWTPALHDRLIPFLTAHKKSCAGFLERAESFVKTDNQDCGHCFLLTGDSGNMTGAVLFSPNGLVFHCLPAVSRRIFRCEAKVLLLPLAESEPVFCVAGGLWGTRFLDGLYKKLRRPVMEFREFHLMEYAPEQAAKKRARQKTAQTSIAGEKPIVECSIEHEDALFPLRKAYELEEVIPEGVEFREAACRASLRRNLKEGRIAGILRAGSRTEFAAMAAVNARAESVVQIGGVYTIPEFRNHGYATALAGFLAQKAAREGKSCVLFVRTKNTPATRLYGRAGFVKNGRYGVAYYR
jgi:ribosomal protein S18 acetylase RimI-like enzyme